MKLGVISHCFRKIIVLFLLLGLISFLTSSSPVYSLKKEFVSSPTRLEKSNKNIISTDVDKLEKYLTVEEALLGVADNVSIYFKDLHTNKVISLNPLRSWIPASTIKAFVMLEAFRQRRIGQINFDNKIKIKGINVVPTELELDEFPRLREGATVTIKQLIDAMIVQSDNIAFNTLLEVLDRRNINETLRDLGITETIVGEKLNLDDPQFRADLQVSGRQPNSTTVKDFITLFDLLYTHQLPGSEEMLSILKRQKINNMIPALLPENTTVAHKTGDWAPIYHDGGVIYKPSQPFLLGIFSNANDPSIVSKLARVAYYQTADEVGKEVSVNILKKGEKKQSAKVFLAENINTDRVLGVATLQEELTYIVKAGDTLWDIAQVFYGTGGLWKDIAQRNKIQNPSSLAVGQKLVLPFPHLYGRTEEKFPEITAADLGITARDLNIHKETARKINGALIDPRSSPYGIKRFFEDRKIKLAHSKLDTIDLRIEQAKNRLSELKSLLQQKNVAYVSKLLNELENDIREATKLANSDKIDDLKLLEIKQTNDLVFAVLAQYAGSIPHNNKEDFVNNLYIFYRINKKEVGSLLEQSITANPFQQQPLIGTITEIQKNTVSMKFEDGTTKSVVISSSTPMRDFHKTEIDSKNNLKVGAKIAIISQRTRNNEIAPIFVLRDIPKELPNKHTGKVVEIDAGKNILKIQTDKGKQEAVQINERTILHGRDTSVSLEGIRAGSTVTIYGELKSKTSDSNQGQSANSNTSGNIEKKLEKEDLKATSVTVTGNSSGAQEKIEKKSDSESKKQEGPKKSENLNTSSSDSKEKDSKPTEAPKK